MNETEIAIIKAMADNDLNVSRAARSLYMHLNTVYYHLRIIKKREGLDPRVFWDEIKLLEKIKHNKTGGIYHDLLL